MTRHPLGIPAPRVCGACKRALWWDLPPGDERPQLVDVKGRRRCRPLVTHGFGTHFMRGIPR